MSLDRMSPLDATFLHIEDPVTHMHIGSVSVFEGPPPAQALLREHLAGKLNRVPRYRQIVRMVPFDLGRPVWAKDPHFNLDYHLRRTALASPGGDGELRSLVGRLMSQKLDRSKPLWELWVVEGLDGDQWAIVSKVHHCMVDGVAGSDLLSLILDLTPDPGAPEAPRWDDDRAPANWELAAEAVRSSMSSPFEMWRALRARTRMPRRAVRQLGEAVDGLRASAGLVRPTPRSSLNGPIGPHRRWTWATSEVADIKTIRHSLGGTFNDVVLAVITRGFRDLLLARGEPVDRAVRTLVPVSVRGRDARGVAVGDGAMANRVSAVFADLPVGLADPVERLRAVSAQMDGIKDSKAALAGEALTNLGGFAPPALLALGGRLAIKVAQRNVNTVTTNVPGPQVPLYAGGRRMTRVYPFVPVALQLRVGVAIFSYDGSVGYGITGDYDSAPDIEVLAEGITAGMAELLAVSGRPDADAGIDPDAVLDGRRNGALARHDG